MSFSSANLAVVAYAFVNQDGTTPDLNSGVTATKRSDIGDGVYDILLPGAPDDQETLQQGQGGPFTTTGSGYSEITHGPIRDLISITPSLYPYAQPDDGAMSFIVKEISPYLKRIFFFNRNGNEQDNPYNTAFYFLMLRPTINPPESSPA